MTVAVTPRFQNFPGNSTTGPFTFNFPIVLDNSNAPYITVTYITAAGVSTVLSYPGDFSFVAASLGLAGGSVTTAVAVTTGDRLFVEAATPLDQTVKFSNQGDFFPETHEKAYDKLHYIVQENSRNNGTAIRIPSTDVTGTNITLPSAALRANMFAAFDALGNVIASPGGASVPISVTMQAFVQATTLAIARAALGSTTVGDALFITASAAAARTTLGLGTAALLASTALLKNVAIQVFTSSGTYTPTAGMVYALGFTLGAGGGGGGVALSSSFGAAGGGGAGALSIKLMTAATVGASKAVTIGAGGAGGVAGNNAGQTGGDTSIGTLCVAKAGTGASGTAANSRGSGSGGGQGGSGTGDVTGSGSNGMLGNNDAAGGSGHGGATIFGAGGQEVGFGNSGNLGSGYGGGGSGGADASSGGNRAGGAGAPGLVFVIEFLNA